MKSKQQIRKIAVCGVMSALELVILYLSGVFQAFDLSLAAFTVIFSVLVLIEYGKKPAWAIYGAVSVLALIIVPQKFTAVCYLLFFGCYPVIKAYLEKPKKLLSWILKLLVFNAAFMLIYFVSIKFVLVEEIAAVGSTFFFITLGLGNVAFILFDYVLTLIITLYIFKLRKKFGFDRIFNK